MLTRRSYATSRALARVLADIEEHRSRAGVRPDRYDVEAARKAQIHYDLGDAPGVAVRRETGPGVECLWAVPDGAMEGERILYVHGGGFCAGDWSSHSGAATWLAHYARRPLLFVEYRRAPEHRFPAALEDTMAAWHWLAGNAPQRPARAEALYIVGDSAGAGLALSAARQLCDGAGAEPSALGLIGAWVNLDLASSPFLQSGPQRSQMAEQYLGAADPRDPRISPLHGDLTGLPPILVQVGADEVLTQECLELGEKLEAAGARVTVDIWPDMPHVWHRFAARLPEALDALREMAAFIDAVSAEDGGVREMERA